MSNSLLRYLLESKEGRAHVATCLLEAWEKNGEIRSTVEDEPRATSVIHIVKSRETKNGFVTICDPTISEFMKNLPPFTCIEAKTLEAMRSELRTLRVKVREQRRELERASFVAQQKTTDATYLRKAGEEACGDLRGLHAENGLLKRSLENYKEMADDLQVENRRLREDMNGLRTACDKHEMKVHVLTEQLGCVSAALDVAKKTAHDAVDEEADAVRMHDDFVHEVLNVLEPDFYDPNTPGAKSGFDYPAIHQGLKKMKAKALSAEHVDKDFGEQFAELIAHGLDDQEILERLDEDQMELLVGLARKLTEKK